jgi:pyridoxal phosphate enzyme (YggS family)
MSPYSNTLARIEKACEESGRSHSKPVLIAVSKTQPAERLAELAHLGQRDFGESYVQEALRKRTALAALGWAERGLIWHFIGPIQSNKTRLIAEHFDWVHSVDRLKIAERLAAQRPAGLPPLQVCLEVNISAEASKSGVLPSALPALAQAVAKLPHLHLRGLMAIPAPSADPASQHAAFRHLRQLLEQLRAAGLDLDVLSMGMSGDLEAAIAEGATHLRIGTALFGERVYS